MPRERGRKEKLGRKEGKRKGGRKDEEKKQKKDEWRETETERQTQGTKPIHEESYLDLITFHRLYFQRLAYQE